MNQPTGIGRSLNGRDRVTGLPGREGMSAVCELVAPSRKRVVAIKILLSYRSTVPDFVQRLEKEAAAVAVFRYPSIVQVQDFSGNEDDHLLSDDKVNSWNQPSVI